jgi:hypothetical protein
MAWLPVNIAMILGHQDLTLEAKEVALPLESVSHN